MCKVMTAEEILLLINQGEGVRIEFKECLRHIPDNFYDTVCSFSNREGGTILLGVSDNGIIQGIPDAAATNYLRNIITAMNDRTLIDPPITVQPIKVSIKDKT